MSRDTSDPTEEANSTLADWSRRTLLKATGASVALAGLGGASVVGTAQEDDGDGDDGDESGEEEEEDGEDGDDSSFVEDLVDPTWGYPLAADETDSVDIDTVVELVTEEGEGVHENFPLNPESGEPFPLEFYFDPAGIHVPPGGVVHFLSAAGEHTVTAFHEKYGIPQRPVPNRIPDGVEGFTSPPIVDGESWLYQFEAAGVYDVLCLPHLSFGMVMRVVVADPETTDLSSEAFAMSAPENLPANVTRVLGAPELDPANVVEQETVAWADLTLDEQ
ncbi:plastocyanin/azurin family copper-binding protein [Halobacterium rubrum]|uniref:plastocyanin/azurin family copper-binding protein n=1 Tax=Halobacterium TaxID=2239 RepID=UPI001F032DAA|nr:MULTISPECIES: plastocyanin/azurin family copper-binding protein [Halobacterium]MDH5020711.1 plastocyanin/azurin family copper-binding protein [Halobacterium rubrum]